MADIYFTLIGFVVGGVGTLVGAGGGFLLAPLLIFLYPSMSPAQLTALSLLAVAANSISGSMGYALRRQVHWRSTWFFSLAAAPGVFVGVRLSQWAPRGTYEFFFGVFLIAISLFVFFRSLKPRRHSHHENHFWNRRTQLLGAGISFLVGVLSSLLGIGGGIVHVPLLSEVLAYPIHLAAGTSHAILAITSLLAVVDHYHAGDLTPTPTFVPYLVLGLVLGAQGGAALSKKVASHRILQILALALLSVGLRLIYKNWGS